VGLAQVLSRALRSQSEIEAHEEVVEAALHGTQPVADTVCRQSATVSGVLRAVTYSAPGARPELVAELYDGSGALDLVWLGRREIPGIEPGRRLVATGRVTQVRGYRNRVVYNPDYRLLPRSGGA
jgi:hypothetical protein